MKVTVITTESGQLIGVQLGHSSELRERTAEGACVVAGPGQCLQEIEVPDEFENLGKLEELHRYVEEQL